MSNLIMLPATGVLGTSSYQAARHTSVPTSANGWGGHPMSAADLGTSEFGAAVTTAAAVSAVARKRGRPPRGEPR